MPCPQCGASHLPGPCPTGPARPESARTLRKSGGESGGLPAGESFGRYEILSPLGRGGMGAVYKARDRELGRDVALKVMLAGAVAGPDELERFNREKTAVASLAHPHIVALFDSGTHDGCPWFCMEFVDGRPLDVVLRRERLPLEQALGIARDVARALQYAHDKGVVHRDVKPGNILVDAAGRPRLTDFGLARQVEGGSALTMSGEVLGTPQYMAPEQAGGKVRQIDARSDVWSLGAVMYEMLTLEPPHKGDSMVEILRRAVETDVTPVRRLAPRVPRAVETICMKALERSKDRRYATAGELADDIDRFLRREPIRAVPPSPASRVFRWSQRHPLPAAALFAAVFVGGPAAWWLATRPGLVEVKVTGAGKPLRPLEVRVGSASLPLTGDGARGHVPAGAWEVHVRAPGYREGVRVVTVKRGGQHEVQVPLDREQGVFELEVEPAGGSVFVDGDRDYGSKLAGFRIDTGAHDLLVRKEGHHDVRLRWEARAGEETRGVVSLARATIWSENFRSSNWQMRWAGDADGDGLPELLHREFSNFHLWDPWKRREVWNVSLGGATALSHETADFDGDGVLDVVTLQPPGMDERLVAWGGRPDAQGRPKPFWRVTGAPAGAGEELAPMARPLIARVDGDGVPDVVAVSAWAGVAVAYSGRDGSVLWTAPVGGVPLGVAGADGGRAFIATSVETVCLELDSGRALWRVPVVALDPAADEAAAKDVTGTARAGHSWLVAAPLDAEPGDDLLIQCWTEKRPTPLVRGLAGRDGRTLWSTPPVKFMIYFGAETLHDADGDGSADFLAVVPVDAANGMHRTTLYRGDTGTPLWTETMSGSCRFREWSDTRETFAMELTHDVMTLRDPRDGSARLTVPLGGRISGWPETEDWDGDGADELVCLMADRSLVARGRDGRLVGSCLLEAPARQLFPSGDADGDGMTDFLVGGELPSVVLGSRILWQRRSDTAILSRPMVLDADGDGSLEVVVFAQIDHDKGLTLLDARTGLVERVAEGWNMRAPAVVPAGGGSVDFLAVAQVGETLTQLRLYRGADLSVLRSLPIPKGYASPLAADLDGDGALELAFSPWDTAPGLRVLDARTWEPRWSYDAAPGAWAPPVPFQDGGPRLACGFLSGRLAVLDARDGAEIWSRELGGRFETSPAVADLDGDGSPEILFHEPASPGRLTCLRSDGSPLWSLPDSAGTRTPVVRDLDRDGRPEILAATAGLGLVCLRSDGSLCWNSAVPNSRTGTPHLSLAELVVDDLDADAKPEVLVTLTDGSLRVLDAASGRLLWSFRTQHAFIEAGACAADVDGDGVKEVFLAGNDRWLTCIRGMKRR